MDVMQLLEFVLCSFSNFGPRTINFEWTSCLRIIQHENWNNEFLMATFGLLLVCLEFVLQRILFETIIKSNLIFRSVHPKHQ